MKTQILVDKVQCGFELGGISGEQVLTLVKKQGLPCVYLTRRTIRFELNAVREWAKTRPALRKTEKQREAEEKRRKRIKAKRKVKTHTA